MEKGIIDLNDLHKKLALSKEQKELLSDALEGLMFKYGTMANNSPETISTYFSGVDDGLNNAFKVINNTDDDYNSTYNPGEKIPPAKEKKYTKSEVFEIALHAMNMGMTLRQDQLNGGGGDKSGKDLLKEYFDSL